MKSILVVLLLSIVSSIFADYNSHRVDSHAPITVMGDHTHKKGDVMLSYRYMSMRMAGASVKGNSQSISELLNDYNMAPVSMSMDMHMFGAMYGLSERITVMGMLPVVSKEMLLQKQDTSELRRESDGISDVSLSALYSLRNTHDSRLHLQLGASLPVGSISDKDGSSKRLAYPMQLGSGTVDVLLGATFVKQLSDSSYGSQFSSTLRSGKNKHDYRLGNRYQLQAWYAKLLSEKLSGSVKVDYSIWDAISGADSDLNPAMMPGAESNRSGNSLLLSFGMNLQVSAVNRVAFEVSRPLSQYSDIPMLDTDWSATFGIQRNL